MNKVIIVLIVGILTACNLFQDRKNINDVGETLVKAIVDNDSIKIKELFIYKMDSVDKERRNGIQSTLQEFNNRKYVLIKIDTNTSVSFFEADETLKFINTYFKVDSNYFNLKTRFTRDEQGNISIHTLRAFDLSAECNDWKIQPYRLMTG